MDYLKLLKNSYWYGGMDSYSRYGFLADHIFDFTTYDGLMSSLFGEKALEVAEAITENKTFDYIENPENYKWYLWVCNTPFFYKKLEWGTSIRGAWWNLHGDDTFVLSSCGLYDESGNQILELEFTKEQWIEFVKAMRCFIDSEE